jgi:hypothetical protein
MTIKLFNVTTVVKEFNVTEMVEFEPLVSKEFRYANVEFGWIAVRERHEHLRLPYAEMIKGWKSPQPEGKDYEECALQECLTQDEAMALAAYLLPESIKITIEPQLLPIGSCMPLGSCMSSGQGFVFLHERKGYPLRFKAAGYYDLRHYDPINEESK